METTLLYEGDLSQTVALTPAAAARLGDMPTRGQCNTGVVAAAGGLVLIDYPAQRPADELIQEAEAHFNKPVTHILLTHAHPDHWDGLATLRRQHITLAASRPCVAEIRARFPRLQNPICPVRPGEVLTMAGAAFRFWMPASLPAHSPWDMVVEYLDEQVLYVGDFLNPPGPLFFRSASLPRWIAAMEQFFTAFDPDCRVVPGHGQPCRLRDLTGTLDYLRDLAALAAALKKTDLPAIEDMDGDCPAGCDLHSRPLLEKLLRAAPRADVLRHLQELAETH